MPEKLSRRAEWAERRALIANDLLSGGPIAVRPLARKHDVSQTTIRNVMREVKASDGIDRGPQAEAIVFERGGRIFANSLNVGARFHKRHDNVKRDISELCCSEKFRSLNFEEVHEINNLGQTVTSINMTKDGFAFLVFGYGGGDAGFVKEEYIERFNAMEAALRKPVAAVMPDLTDAKVLYRFLLDSTQKVIALEEEVQQQGAVIVSKTAEIEFKAAEIERLAPEEDANRRIAKAEGCLCITDAAKSLQMRPKAMFDWLKEHVWIYKRPFNAHWVAYQDKTNAGYLTTKEWVQQMPDGSERVRVRVLVTAKGLVHIAKLLFRTPPKGGGAASQISLPV